MCPYCRAALDPLPAKSRHCPFCKELIIVRTQKGMRILLTQEQATEFEAKRQAEFKRNKSIRRTLRLGLTKEEFERKEDELRNRFGVALPGDVFWELANETLTSFANRGDWQRTGQIYFTMALAQYEDGGSYFHVLQEASRASIRHYHSLPEYLRPKRLRILTSRSDSCTSCQQLEGRSFSIQQALDIIPIPNEHCDRGWCRCIWQPQRH
jgi:hypothetical protein